MGMILLMGGTENKNSSFSSGKKNGDGFFAGGKMNENGSFDRRPLGMMK